MAVQAKKPIREAESSGALCGSRHAAVPFVAPHVDVMLKLLIQSLQQSLVPILNQSINQHPVFLPISVNDFNPYQSVFFLVSSSSLGDFSLIESSVFSPKFLIEFRRFFSPMEYTRFPHQFPTLFKRFFVPSHDLKRLYARRNLRSRRNAIVMSQSHMTSHMMDLTWSGQFQITTHSASRGWLSH